MHLLSLPVLFLLSSFMIPAEATFNLDFSSLLSTLLKSKNNGADSGYVPGSSLSRHKRAALDAEYTVDIEVSFQDPTLQDTIKNFINGLTYPLNLTGGTTIQSINVTTACTQVGTNLQCKCEDGFIWPTDICSNYSQCSDNSTVSSCNCINMTENTGQYCQAATTMSTTTAMTTLSITTPSTTMSTMIPMSTTRTTTLSTTTIPSTTMNTTIPMSTTRTTTLSTTAIPSTTMNTTILLSTTRTTTLLTTTIPSTTMSTTTPKSTTITTTPTTTKTTTRTTTTKSATITGNPQQKSLSLGINELFTDDLKNPSSPKYKEYKNKLDTALSESYKSLPGFRSAAVTGFRPGSVVADYTITADQFDASSIQAANNNLLANLTGIFNLTNPPILNKVTDNITLNRSTEFPYLGDNVTFFCNVSINSYSTINWYLNGGQSIPNATNKTNVLSGMISFTLTISSLTASNAGTYFCIVNQDTNSYQASVNLTVQTIQMNILNGNVICNDAAMSVLSCCPSSEENRLKLSCQNISGNDLTTKSVFWNNVSSCQELQIKATQDQCVSNISSNYNCVCWSNNGAITNQSITVRYSTLQIYPVVDIFKVSQGKVLQLQCKESDSITWKFSSTGNSLTAMPISQTYYTNVGKISTLTIPSDTLNTNWNGTYYCFSNNMTTSRRVDVYSLIPASQIQIQPASFSYVCETSVTFTCCVDNINNYLNAKLIISKEERDMKQNGPCYTASYEVPAPCVTNIMATCKIFNQLNDSVTSMDMTGYPLSKAVRSDKEMPGTHSLQASDSDSDTSVTSRKREPSPLTKKDLKDLLSDMKSLVADELTKHLAPLKEGLTDLTKRTHTLENKMADVTAITSSHEATLKEVQGQIAYLEDLQEDLNNRSRRNNIRIRGLPESSAPEALNAMLHEAFSSLLPDAPPSDLLLDRAHRALRPPSASTSQPRDIIVRCHYFHIKEAIMRATRETPLQIEGHAGLNNPKKRHALLRWAHSQKADILLVQETHFTPHKHFPLQNKHYNRSFHANSPEAKTKGVAVILKASCPLTDVQAFPDKQGRYLTLTGKIGPSTYSITSLYAPTTPDPAFWQTFSAHLTTLKATFTIVGGDCNATHHPTLDRTTKSQGEPRPSHNDAPFSQFLHTHNLLDIWRAQHPSTRDYTFYSHPHNTYSRIDYFLISPNITSRITHTSIGHITWSDHADISLTLSIPNMTRPWTWKLNSQLLQDKLGTMSLAENIKEYFTLNDPSVSSPITLWAAHKPVIRGKLIAIATTHKKQHNRQLMDTISEIGRLETLHKQNPTPSLFDQLSSARTLLKRLSLSATAKALTWTKQKYYEKGNKADSMLAKRLKHLTDSKRISKIRTSDGTLSRDPHTIGKTFQQYFTSLYNHTPNPQTDLTQTLTDDFLKTLSLPSLTDTARTIISADITPEELQAAIKTLKPNKSPGPDGLTAIYYKTFGDILTPRLCKVFNEMLKGTPLPPDMTRANITLLPKPGKTHEDPGHFRPISLLNIDLKLLTKVMTTRINPLLPKLINPDQALTSPDSEAQLPDLLENISAQVNSESSSITNSSNNLALVVSMLSQVNNVATTVQKSLMQNFLSTVNVVVNDSSVAAWKNAPDQTAQSSNLLQSVENFANKLVFNVTVSIKANTNVQLAGLIVDQNTNTFQENFTFDGNLTGNVYTNTLKHIPPNSSIVSIAYSTLKDIIPTGNNTQVLNGLVMTTTISNRTSTEDFKISMNFKTSNNSLKNPKCVFWNFTTESWDGAGCSIVGNNSDNVSCECTHLTSFSILMSYGDPKPKPVIEVIILDYITYIGVGISMLSLVICICVEATVWKSVTKNKTSYMRHVCIINIAVSLLLADIWFIIGDALTPKSGVPVSDACVATTFFTHFFYLSVFFWMLTMGLILFYRLVYVLHDMSKTNMMTISFALGYGCPLVISVITVAVTQPRNLYTSSNACWLNTTESKAFIAFVVPALAILLVNVMIVFVVLKKLCRPAVGDKQKKDDSSTLKHIAKCILILTPLLGLTWGFGIGTVASQETWIHGIFAALNSLQGLFILLFGCLMDKKVREALFHTFSLSRFTSQQTKTTNTNSSDSPFPKTVMNKGVFNLFHKKGAYNISSAHVSSSSDIPSNSYSLLH
ncbi:adhesion G protein-coupled receptor F5-like [Pelobates fuscus]|uniref:adhesion G protein-coupled receptor F5-like n=1 Tax=Pelobates fuscus TaxID=191477 RepID=UPI002FE46004